MKKFLIKSIIFLLIFNFLLIFKNWINNNSLKIDFLQHDKVYNKIFNDKLIYFSDFIGKNNSFNLILGSSMLDNAIIPDSLGTNWFSFCIPEQNIYNSFQFLDYYKNSVKIDTILMCIQPFDFPDSYISNRKNNLPLISRSFSVFDDDSTSLIEKNSIHSVTDNDSICIAINDSSNYFIHLEDAEFPFYINIELSHAN